MNSRILTHSTYRRIITTWNRKRPIAQYRGSSLPRLRSFYRVGVERQKLANSTSSRSTLGKVRLEQNRSYVRSQNNGISRSANVESQLLWMFLGAINLPLIITGWSQEEDHRPPAVAIVDCGLTIHMWTLHQHAQVGGASRIGDGPHHRLGIWKSGLGSSAAVTQKRLSRRKSEGRACFYTCSERRTGLKVGRT